MQRLRNQGMLEEDRKKLYELKSFISRSSKSRLRMSSFLSSDLKDDLHMGGVVSLKRFGLTPHTLFLSPPDTSTSTSSLSLPVVDFLFCSTL
jgi:hypothetical protein